jgi:hypothetical protein
VGIAAAALGGLITGGLGVISGRRQAAKNNATANQANADLAKNYQDMIAQNASANSRLSAAQAQDAQTAATNVAPAQDTIGDPGIARALKYGGWNTINTSQLGDTTAPNTARRRLLS